jgi:thioredoxin-dependent peroxiredoxin
VRTLYGVSSVLGNLSDRLTGRVTFVIDKKGVVRYVFSSQLQPTRHVKEALGALNSMKPSPP